MPHAKREFDVLTHCHMGKQGIFLEHHADIAMIGCNAGDVLVSDMDRACRRRLESGNHGQKRGLAGTGRSHDRDKFTRLDLDAGVMDSTDLPVTFLDMAERQCFSHGVPFPVSVSRGAGAQEALPEK